MAPDARASTWNPLRRRAFRALFIAQFVSNSGTWTQLVGAQWLMGDLGGGPLQIALVQTATTLPVCLLALPAGALGDIVDRRRILLASQSLMLAGAAGLAVLTAAGVVTPVLLLTLIAVMGIGQAMAIPSFAAIQPELVSLEEIPQVALLQGANVNVARAVGPAIGGVLIAAVGPQATFALNAVSFLGVLLVLFGWRRPADHRPLGAEAFRGALRAGARYVASAPQFATILGRSLLFVTFGSALWALLPAVARGPLDLGAAGYGVLLASVGVGAVSGAFIVPGVRERLGGNGLVGAGTILYGAAMLALGLVHSSVVAVVALVAAGLAWIAVQSTLNANAQILLPDWTRARALAYSQLVFQGGQALGAVAWGVVAQTVSVEAGLVIPAAGLLVGTAVGVRALPLAAADLDVRATRHWPEPSLVIDPGRDAGPVLVTVEYRVDPADAAAFARAMRPVGRARRRTGASLWGLFRDVEDPSVLLETFTVATWHEHLRQHLERGTVMDREVEARAYGFLLPGTEPRVRHLLWAYASMRAESPRSAVPEIERVE
jgi:MFS family permease